MKIRIFALAKELGMDSKVLIDHAATAGVKIKNSALASISPEERDIVVQYIKQLGSGGATAVKEESRAPVRQPVRDVASKVRSIKPIAPKPQDGRQQPPAESVEPEAAEDASVEASEPEVEPTASVEAVEPEPAAPAAGLRGVQPMQPHEYVPLRGSHKTSIREMKPRGTVPDTASRQPGPPKGKAKQSLPQVAAPPTYKPPKPKEPKREQPAVQKPDIPLTAESFAQQQSPLRAHLQEKKKKKRTGEDEVPDRRDAEGRPIRSGAPGFGDGKIVRRDRRRGGRRVLGDESSADVGSRAPRRRRQKGVSQVALKTAAVIEPPITIRSLSEAMGRPAKELMRSLMERGEMVTINANVADEVAQELAMEFGVELEIRKGRDVEEDLTQMFEGEEEESELLVDRPPVITILGHVDHGKTTLLDKLREANVAAGEAGGITQHIAAYQVEYKGKKLTFVDTPGHEAFGEMRARGANVTDIVVLVVAADDGVMPQTVECISHAKSAGVPIVVALNKMDLPDIKEQRTLQDLASHEVLPQEWGGDTEVVRTSGSTGKGLDDLLETLLLTAELHEFKTNPDRAAVGVCLEAFRDEGRGALAWLLVQKGTLHVGDVVLCGATYGRIRAIYNDRNQELQSAGPSTPVKVAGLNAIPGAGDHFFVMSTIEEARTVAESREARGRTAALSNRRKPRTLEDILTAARGGAVQDLPLIVKADSPGSIEALRAEIGKLEHPEVRVQIVHEGVGGVNDSDVYLASASGAIIVAFHVVPEEHAQQLAEREGVEIRRYNIIYEVTQKIKTALEGLLVPERVEVATGRALVLRTFHISRIGTIAGCRVLNGAIERSNRVHVIRDQTVLSDYNIASLKREKDDAREVREGLECGIRLDGFNDVKEGDLLEAYRVDEIKRTLD